jgi:hypothetical protein
VAKLIYEADRHAEKELNQCVRRVHPLAQQLGNRSESRGVSRPAQNDSGMANGTLFAHPVAQRPFFM